ncbi:MAG: hypothetical protein GAK33_01084 [Burkholderia lata]|uniref:Arginine:ornithine antiporter n=1 Tax=Burkholderia lata (strain ATCC 17760 / DSM 23089 / LMG 22485 / NCIMB 9086 / R18194 / 383) TaxID=482957 RepID=A0A833PX94_BURL3|nr:hypothetical protein [Burkholderia lata]KAF1040084.1 MAG: hypothetical protein GAK33_01084 [Burkholderia lata]
MTRPLYLFWGGLDLLYLIRYVWINVADGRIPIVADLQAFSQLDQPHWFAGLSLLLLLSIVASACLFLLGRTAARRLAYVQEPLRLLLAVPSLSFIPWLLTHFGITSLVLSITLLLGSEALKIISLHMTRRYR